MCILFLTGFVDPCPSCTCQTLAKHILRRQRVKTHCGYHIRLNSLLCYLVFVGAHLSFACSESQHSALYIDLDFVSSRFRLCSSRFRLCSTSFRMFGGTAFGIVDLAFAPYRFRLSSSRFRPCSSRFRMCGSTVFAIGCITYRFV